MSLSVEFSPEVAKKIDEIANERYKGAADVARMTLSCFLTFARGQGQLKPEDFWAALFNLAKRLIVVQPDMAPQFTLANRVLLPVKEALSVGEDTAGLIARLEGSVEQLEREGREALQTMAQVGIDLIQEGETVMTHSHSSSVKELLVKTHRTGRSFDVIVTESRPGLEGKILAEELGREGIATTLIVEAAVSEMLRRSQKVFFGADRMTEHHFVNKVGTRGIALGAKEAGVDVFVVCDTSKFVPYRFGLFANKQHPKGEVQKSVFPNVIIENPYFEVIPLSLVTVVLCELGLLPPSGVSDYVQQAIHFPELLEP